MIPPRQFYHSFQTLGLSTKQRPGIYSANQRCKEPYILGYLLLALAKCRRNRVRYRPTVLELFCADAYYGFFAKRFGAGLVVGVDRAPEALAQAAVVRDALGLEIDLRRADVVRAPLRGRFDIVLCTGGFYHLSDPVRFLRKVRKHVKQYLIAQSVVSLESDDPEYFVTPAPGWKHGSRFSAAYFLRMLKDTGFEVLGYGFNHLEGNRRACDRGSAYALCGLQPERWPS